VTFNERVRHWSYDSRLHDADDNCRMLELTVRTHVVFATVGQRFSRNTRSHPTATQAWTSTEQNHFKTMFRRGIHDIWNNKLWLCYEQPTADEDKKDVKCGVTIDYVSDSRTPALEGGVHLRILVMKTNSPDARSRCVIGGAATARGEYDPDSDERQFNRTREQDGEARPGRARTATDRDIDMYLNCDDDYTGNSVDELERHFTRDHRSAGAREPAWPSRSERRSLPMQRAFAHEFGHYLGLDHQCMRTNPRDPYCRNQSTAQRISLMALGERIYRYHAYPWLNRIQRPAARPGVSHEYYLGTTWIQTTNLQATRRQRLLREREMTRDGYPIAPGGQAAATMAPRVRVPR